LCGRAATLWTGPLMTYTQPAPDPTFPTNQDILTAHVSLTRGNPVGGGSGGMFNGITETAFTKLVSPADTEWAIGELTNYATLIYSDWTSASGGNPVHNYPGQQLVVHLISDNIYLSLKYTDLPAGPGFTYNRSTPPGASNAPPTVAITSPKRSPLLPNVPTVAESGFPGYDMDTWIGTFVPRATPPAALKVLHEATVEALKSPAVRERIEAQAGNIIGAGPGELDALVAQDIKRYSKIVRERGIKPE